MNSPSACCSLALALLVLAGCESLPGEKKTQGAVIGGVAGAAAGAVLADEDDRLLGAVIGGAIGAGGGYIIGKEIEEDDEDPPVDPEGGEITAEQVASSVTADVDGDGNVTMAEIVALEKAGLTDAQILQRLRATNVQFYLNDKQEQELRDRGVSSYVVAQLETINRSGEVIGTGASGRR
jgi:hypothetical protein